MERFKQDVAHRLAIPVEELFGKDILLRDVIAMSPSATNSIDLLESFAGALADLEWDGFTNLPAFTLENTIDSVIDEIENQVKEKAH